MRPSGSESSAEGSKLAESIGRSEHPLSSQIRMVAGRGDRAQLETAASKSRRRRRRLGDLMVFSPDRRGHRQRP